MEKQNLQFTRMFLSRDYYIDILPSAEDEDVVELWMHKKGLGDALHLFGFPTEVFRRNEKRILDNAPEYIYIYKAEFECEE